MSTESKQLTPTERVEQAACDIKGNACMKSVPKHGDYVPADLALELATELERIQKELATAKSIVALDQLLRITEKLERVQMECANAQFHWNQERDELKRQVKDKNDWSVKACAELAKLRTENTELRKDIWNACKNDSIESLNRAMSNLGIPDSERVILRQAIIGFDDSK